MKMIQSTPDSAGENADDMLFPRGPEEFKPGEPEAIPEEPGRFFSEENDVQPWRVQEVEKKTPEPIVPDWHTESIELSRNLKKRPAAKKKTAYPLSHCALFINEICNLDCDYCYGKRREEGQRVIDEKTGRDAVDFLFNQSGPALSIGFFGGEPLLSFNIMKALLNYSLAKNKQFSKRLTFNINTNGIPIDREKMDFIRKYKMGITLSIDGTPAAHDRFRKDMKGEGSYRLLEEKLPLFLEKPEAVHVRMTVTPESVEDMYEGVLHIYGLGFPSLAIAMDRAAETWTKEKREIFRQEYKKTVDWYMDRLRDGEKFYLVDLDFGAVSLTRPLPDFGIPCNAAMGGVAISPDGKIYPCYRFEGMRDTEIGDIYEGFNEEKRKKYLEYSCYKVAKCRDCPRNFRCHRCPWLSYIKTGDLFMPVEINCFESELMMDTFKYFKDTMEAEGNAFYLIRKNEIQKRFFMARNIP